MQFLMHQVMHNANDVGVNAQIINNTIKEIKGNKKSQYINILMRTYSITSYHTFKGLS